MKPILYESTLADTTFLTNGICRLSDTLSCLVTEERNGEYTMTLEYPFNGLHADEITPQRIVKVKAGDKTGLQCFRIYSVTQSLDGEKLTVKANHISYDLSYFPVAPFTASINSVAGGITAILNNSINTTGFYNQSDYDPSEATMFSVSVPKSVKSCLLGSEGSILDRFGGEFEWENRLIKWHEARGADNGVTIAYGKNLMSYEQEMNFADVYTGILPYYASEDTVIYGDIQYSSNRDDFPFPKAVAMDFSGDFDVENPPTVAQLNARAQTFIASNSVGAPKVSFDVEFFPLGQLPEYSVLGDIESVDLCDTVTVLFPELTVRAKAKVVRTVYNSLLERYENIELGSIRTNIVDTISGLADSVENGGGSSTISNPVDVVINKGEDSGTGYYMQYRKWSSGVSELWGWYDVTNIPCTTAAGALYVTASISPNIAFPDGVFLNTEFPSMQMTFHSPQGTPGFVWCDASANPTVGLTPFRLMRHSSATINGRMEYSYKGRWK